MKIKRAIEITDGAISATVDNDKWETLRDLTEALDVTDTQSTWFVLLTKVVRRMTDYSLVQSRMIVLALIEKYREDRMGLNEPEEAL